MNAVRACGPTPATTHDGRYLCGVLAEILPRIREPEVALAVWKRRLTRAVAKQAGCLSPPAGTLRWRIPVAGADRDGIDAAIDAALAELGAGPLPAFHGDLRMLVELARCASPQSDALQLRISRVSGPGCHLFHVDQVGLRLICTYTGPATQWLPEHAVRRSALVLGNNDGVLDWQAVQQLATGDVAIMKGERFPRHQGKGLVHRSPPGADTTPRTVVAIDSAR